MFANWKLFPIAIVFIFPHKLISSLLFPMVGRIGDKTLHFNPPSTTSNLAIVEIDFIHFSFCNYCVDNLFSSTTSYV